jgi:calcium-dependent protein kinase
VIAEHLSVEEVAGIKEAFDSMDTGKKGSINLEELRVGLQKLGQHIADADLQILMEAVSLIVLLAEKIPTEREKDSLLYH